jgi:two-component system, NarL family, response regulator DesR
MGNTRASGDLDSGPAERDSAPQEAPVTRVLVAEDVDDVRDTLVALLGLEDDLDVVAELASGDQIVPAALQHRPDVAVIDIDLPHVDGLTAAAELRRRLPACRTLILTGLARPGNLNSAVAAGASAFLTKDGPADGLIDAVRRVARGERLIGPPHPQPEQP